MASKFGRAVVEFSALSVAAAAAGAAYMLSAPTWALPLAAIGAWSTMQVLLVRPAVSRPKAPRALADTPNYDEAINEVMNASQHILVLSQRAEDPLVRQRGLDISSALNRVIEHLKEDPEDLHSSQKFLAVYIERTQAILGRYIRYENIATPQAEQVRRKVRDELLPLLVQLCDAQLHRITYDDLRSLETDVDVLRKSITLEGL